MHSLKLLFVLSLWAVNACAVEVVVQSGHTAAVTDVAYNKDGTLLISASEDGTVRIWSSSSGHLLRLIEAHAGGVSGLAISYNDKYVVTTGKDGYAKIWSIDSGELVRQNAFGDSITSVNCSPIAPQCALASGTRVVLLPLDPTRQIRTLDGLIPTALRTCRTARTLQFLLW
jgi:WD40 repeat protein